MGIDKTKEIAGEMFEVANCNLKSTVSIENKILTVRNVQVMMDCDLAELYGIETKVLKQAVKRNLKRFPSDFMFELTQDEFECLRSQFVTSNARGGTRYMPFVFTEQGVAIRKKELASSKSRLCEVIINFQQSTLLI